MLDQREDGRFMVCSLQELYSLSMLTCFLGFMGIASGTEGSQWCIVIKEWNRSGLTISRFLRQRFDIWLKPFRVKSSRRECFTELSHNERAQVWV